MRDIQLAQKDKQIAELKEQIEELKKQASGSNCLPSRKVF